MNYSLSQRIDLLKQAIQSLEGQNEAIQEISNLLLRELSKGRRVLTCGNGGSATQAMHFASELSGRYRSSRRPFPAMSLTSDGPTITCIANDFGWNSVFSRQVEAYGRAGDILFVFSTSGLSQNVLSAVIQARKQGVVTIGILGRDGGEIVHNVDHHVVVASSDTAAIQEAHVLLMHYLCESLEEA